MNVSEAFQDNLVLDCTGISAGGLTPAQRDHLAEGPPD